LVPAAGTAARPAAAGKGTQAQQAPAAKKAVKK